MKNKFISFLLSLVMLAAFVPMSASAAEVASGNCGENATFTYKDGTLIIEGSGDMYGYKAATEAPWYQFASEITNIDISNTITSVGSYAFSNCSNLMNIDFPDGIKSIGYHALYGNNVNIKITLPNSLEKIAGAVISNWRRGYTYITYRGTKDEFFEAEGSSLFCTTNNDEYFYFTKAEAEQINVSNINTAETNTDAQAWYVYEQLNVADSQWSIVVGKDGAEQTITEEIGTTFTNATVQYGVVLYNLGDYEVVSVTLEGGNN